MDRTLEGAWSAARCLRATLLASAALLLAATDMALAQSAANGTDLEEVIVTARRREEKLQDVPIAITAFTAQTIEQRGIRDINEIAQFTPGFNYQNGFGRTDSTFSATIRGVSNITNSNVSFASVGNFIDGLYVPFSIEDIDLASVERVEIIRGPQAAQFGRGTEAGAINFISRQPTNDIEGGARASFASYNEVRVNGHVSGPILEDKLFYTVNASHYSRDGEFRNTATGGFAGAQRTETAALGIKFTPSDAFEASARIGYVYDRDNEFPNGIVLSNQANCYLATFPYYCGVIPTTDSVRLEGARLPFNGLERSDTRASLKMAYTINDWTISSLSGFDTRLEREGLDQTYVALPTYFGVPAALSYIYKDHDRNYSTELRVSSPFWDQLHFETGVYYYHQTHSQTYVQQPLQVFLTGTPDAFVSSVRNQAVFALASYTPEQLPGLNATLEMRAAKDVISFVDRTTVAPVALRGIQLSQSSGNVTPRFTVDYALTPDLKPYINIARGTKPGGFNALSSPSNLIRYNEEKLWNYEIGLKGEWLDHRLQANIDYFYMDIKGEQLTQAVVQPTGLLVGVSTNAGQSHTQGIELEGHALVTNGVRVDLTYSWTEAELDDFQGYQDLCTLAGIYSSNASALAACVRGPQGNAAGKRLPNTPEHQLSVGLDVTQPLWNDWRYFVRPILSYRSTMYDQVENLAETGDNTILNVRLGVETDSYAITAFATNLTGENNAQYVLRYTDLGAKSGPYGAPRAFVYAQQPRRQFGIEASVKF